jgi:hypothetical protein
MCSYVLALLVACVQLACVCCVFACSCFVCVYTCSNHGSLARSCSSRVMASSGSEPPASSPVAPATVVIVIIPPAAPAPSVVTPSRSVRPLPIDFFFCNECGNFKRYSTTCVECDLVGCAEFQPGSVCVECDLFGRSSRSRSRSPRR